MQILIAEDDKITRKILSRMLNNWGHEIVEASNGSQAWEIIEQSESPNLIVLDWMMPGMDGLELCRRLRTLKRDIRPYTILLTALSNKKDLVEGFNAGADDYATKPFDPEELKVRIRAGERIIDLQVESLAARDTLRRLATFDFLTGLRNRAAILEELQREFGRSERTQLPINVVMGDIDHFKRINDTYGHQVGDRVLAELARRMASVMRSYESIGRYGGEEFLIVLSGCDLTGAGKQAERVRRAVVDRPFEIWGVPVPVTISLGVASSTQLENPGQEELIEMADSALYSAKLSGRNRVEIAIPAFLDQTQSNAVCRPLKRNIEGAMALDTIVET